MNKPQHQAGYHVQANVPWLEDTKLVKEAESLLRKQAGEFDTINYIYIKNQEGALVGVASIREIFAADPKQPLSTFCGQQVIAVPANMDQEKAAHLAIAYDLKALPVLSEQGEFLGVMPSDTILDILNHEHTEDVLRFAGVSPEGAVQDNVLLLPAEKHVRARLPWLIVGLLGGIAAAFLVSSYEKTLSELVIVASFIPAVVYIADAVGSQTQMIFVRALTIDHNLPLWEYIRREIIVNGILAFILAVLSSSVVFVWLRDYAVSLVLGLSIFLTVSFTVMVAIALPLFFERRGLDPAIASGPLATVIRDLISLLIYFMIASLFL